VDESRARHERQLRVERQQCVLQGVPRVTRPGVHDEARRLVDHAQRAVPEHDRERHGLGLHPALRGQRRADTDLLPAKHPVLAPQRPAIDLDGARLDPGLEPGAGILRQRLGQCLIKAHPRGFAGEGERMHPELPRGFRGRKSTCGIRYTPRTHPA
jgi:hypothetical protein